jgi:O-succinylbenzoate synthase
MNKLCRESSVPIALDEELIGVHEPGDRMNLLQTIQPKFIVLKPSLLGGILATREWISIAEELGIGWWITSALESNIGLNAIAQLASSLDPILPQGLGTGQLYHNNIASPLMARNGKLLYDKASKWGDMDELFSGWKR